MLPSYLFFLVILPLALSKTNKPYDPELQDHDGDNSDHSECRVYRALATELLKDDRNFYNLQNVFFPPNGGSPVFVTVEYHYFDDDNNVTSSLNTTLDTIYFWSSAVYFFFHPVRVFQFTSLLLSDPSLRYDEVNLFLPANHSNANSNCMVLLTQRLKLYAAHQFERFEAPIDNTYTASAHSADTLISWYDQNKEVGDIAVSSQVVFPILVTFFVSMFVVFIVEFEPYERGKKLRNELGSKDNKVRAKADAGLLTKYIAAALFHLFTLGNDITALVYYRHVPKPIWKYYYSESKFWAAPITMTVFDSITFIFFILIPPMVACCILCNILRKCEQKLPESIVARCKQRNYILIYSVISPLSCIASHSYHIVFAFIINPYHATSILLIYAIIIFVNIQGFQKLFYFINAFMSKCKCSCCTIENTCIRYSTFAFCFIVEFVLMGTSISLSIALIIKLPLSNAIDDAPNHLYVIYQASVTFFAALIAFQVIFRQTNSTFNVFIEAVDRHFKKNENGSTSSQETKPQNHANNDAKTWTELSETEKEIILAKVVLSYLRINVTSLPNFAEEIKTVLNENESSSPQTRCWENFFQCCKNKTQQQSNSSDGDDNQKLVI